MTTLLAILVLALTRAEIIARMKAPVITQCDGLVQVFASCPEDIRQEYQMPIASFAGETVKTLYRGEKLKSARYAAPRIIVHVGDGRTNDTTVVSRVSTNRLGAVSRIYLKSPGYADLGRFRLELVKAFCRAVEGRETDDAEAVEVYCRADPKFRVADERAKFHAWLSGRAPSPSPDDDEANLARMRRVIEPGVASRADVMIFASRLFLYPLEFDTPFCGRFNSLSFREAIDCAKKDSFVRVAALQKSSLLLVYGGGRGEKLSEAAKLYFDFLLELAKNELDEDDLRGQLEVADQKLKLALDEAVAREAAR